MRIGICGRVWGYAAGVCLLAGYGWLVNQPAFGFGRALGLYIAVFFVVSQGVAFLALGDRPSPSLLVGGALIVAGGRVGPPRRRRRPRGARKHASQAIFPSATSTRTRGSRASSSRR